MAYTTGNKTLDSPPFTVVHHGLKFLDPTRPTSSVENYDPTQNQRTRRAVQCQYWQAAI